MLNKWRKMRWSVDDVKDIYEVRDDGKIMNTLTGRWLLPRKKGRVCAFKVVLKSGKNKYLDAAEQYKINNINFAITDENFLQFRHDVTSHNKRIYRLSRAKLKNPKESEKEFLQVAWFPCPWGKGIEPTPKERLLDPRTAAWDALNLETKPIKEGQLAKFLQKFKGKRGVFLFNSKE